MIVPKRIVPHLWFDKEAKDAAAFYTSVFPDSQLMYSTVLHDTPSGDCDFVAFSVLGQEFMAISAGPLFELNPSVSFVISRTSRDEIDALWERLADGGEVLMPLGAYPYSERYGWIQDRYGVSWQLILPAEESRLPPVVPFLIFTGANYGRAEEAIGFYTSVFGNAKQGRTARYGADDAPEREGAIMYADFMLEGQWFAASESAQAHDFAFNEAISLVVRCDTQAEIDRYWAKLSAVPEAEQCGWIKDRYGLSWQIVPTVMDDMMRHGSAAQIARVTRAFLAMKKFDVAALRKAYEG